MSGRSAGTGLKLTLRQVAYFVAAGETGSITLAARRAHISQPAISAAIAHLEAELGTPLFVRHHAQGLSLTSAGRTLLPEARQLLQQADGLYAAAAALEQQPRGELSVGWFGTLAPVIMPALVRDFARQCPQATLRSRVGHQEELLAALRTAEIDLAVTYDLQMSAGLDFRPLAALPPYVIVGRDHPLATRRRVALAELAELPMVLLDLPLSREYFHSLFYAEGLEPQVGTRSDNPEVMRALVANGLGYGLANVRPRNAAAPDGEPLLAIELAGNPRPLRIGIATLPAAGRTRLLDTFVDFCAAQIRDDAVPGMQLKPSRRQRGPR